MAAMFDFFRGAIPQRPYPDDADSIRVLPVDLATQVRAMRSILTHLFYGRDDLVATQVLAHSSSGLHLSVVFFDTVATGWDATQWRMWQAHAAARLVKVVSDSSAGRQVGIRAALCQELGKLKDSLSDVNASGQHMGQAQLLEAALDPAFASGGGCR